MELSVKSRLVSYDYVRDLLKVESDIRRDFTPPPQRQVRGDEVYELYPSAEFADKSGRRRIYNANWAKSHLSLEHDFTPRDVKSKRLQKLHCEV